MTTNWNHDFIDGNTRAACSKCGVPYRWPDELVKLDDGFFYCKRRCLEQTVRTRDRIIAQSRKRREMPPPKFVQPPQYAYDYLRDESQIFNFIMSTAPAEVPGGAGDDLAASNAVVYLSGVVLEGRRPAQWITTATAKIIALCDYLLTRQYGSPSGQLPTLASSDIKYGGVLDTSDGLLGVVNGCLAGVAFADGYRVTGDARYLAAADRSGMFCRAMQCGDLLTSSFRVVWPSGGSPYHTGGYLGAIDTLKAVATTFQNPVSSGVALTLIGRLAGLRGLSYSYGTALSSDFTGSTLATLAMMQSEAAAFLLTGANDSSTGTTVPPIAIGAPRENYNAYTSGGAGTGRWLTPITSIRNLQWPLKALYAAGLGVAQVNDFYDWVMTFTSNPSNVATAGPDSLLAGNKGTFSPAYTIGLGMNVAAHTESTATHYDWNWFGLLAQLQSERYPVAFKAAKDALGLIRRVTANSSAMKYIGPRAMSGFSFQVAPYPTTSVIQAANVGNAYRYAPHAFGDMYSNPTGRNP